MLSAPAIVGGYDAAMLGGDPLETELDGFAHEWHDAMGAVTGEIDLIQMRLAGASAAYRRIEQRHRETAHMAIAHAARGGSGSGTTVIDPGPARHSSSTGSGAGTTVIDGPGSGSTPAGDEHTGGKGSRSGSGTTVIGGGSDSGAGVSGTTVIGGARQPTDAGRSGSGLSSPPLSGQEASSAGR